jgi:hypothetical protein
MIGQRSAEGKSGPDGVVKTQDASVKKRDHVLPWSRGRPIPGKSVMFCQLFKNYCARPATLMFG